MMASSCPCLRSRQRGNEESWPAGGGSNFKSVLSGGMGSHLVISDHTQEAELLSRHLICLRSHSMPHVCGVLLSPVSVDIRHQGSFRLAAVSSASGSPAVEQESV